jgi:hypothetical protein
MAWQEEGNDRTRGGRLIEAIAGGGERSQVTLEREVIAGG